MQKLSCRPCACSLGAIICCYSLETSPSSRSSCPGNGQPYWDHNDKPAGLLSCLYSWLHSHRYTHRVCPLSDGLAAPLVVLSHCPAPFCSFWFEARSLIDFVPCGHFRKAAIILTVGEFRCHLPLPLSLPLFACFSWS